MEQITSRENEKIKYACKLAKSATLRQADGCFFAEGPKLCLELAKDCTLQALYATEAALARYPALAELAVEPVCITPSVADKLAGVPSNQGVFALFATPETRPESFVRPGVRLLALENVQDPGNVGTLLRSAAAFGFDGVICNGGCASAFSPKTLRASMGAAGRIPVAVTEDLPALLADLCGAGVDCLAAALYNSVPLSQAGTEPDGGVCVVIGSEGQGLTEQTIAACSRTVRIPMSDKVESLNAGVAGSVLLWHFRGV